MNAMKTTFTLTLSGILLSSAAAFSADKETLLEQADQKIQSAAEGVKSALDEAKTRRENSGYFVLGNYAPLDLLIPSKLGASAGFVREGGRTTWELEFLRGSISVPFLIKDLGEMTDTRISLIGRSYGGRNSFNFNYGLSYFDFSMTLGNQLLNRVSGGAYPALDLVRIQALGFHLGLGNRWVFQKNFTFGVDWITWDQPVFVTNRQSAFLNANANPGDKQDVETAMNLISYFPRLGFLKLQLGLSF